MMEVWDYVNVSSILLEIIGFVLLLPEFEKFVRKQVDNEPLKGYFQPRIRIQFLNEHSRTVSIILVIIGLIGQGVAVGLENL